MEMQGSRTLAVTQQQAWDALNDPEVLKACIPGCERIESTGEGQYAIGMSVRVGPVAAKFNGRIALSDVVPPQSYTITFDGQGGAAGFGKGSAKVVLAPVEAQSCELTYSANAQVGGKMAQVGQRLIDGVAKSMAEDFFARFDAEMQRRHPSAATEKLAEEPALERSAGPSPSIKVPMWAWWAAAAGVAIVVFILLR